MVEPTLFPEKQPAAALRGMPEQAMLSGMSERVNEIASRLAVLEERSGNLRKNGRVTDQSLISYDKETRTTIRALNERLTELAHKVEEVHEKIDAMSAEMNLVVKRHEITVLERYLDLWQPMSFMTREEAKLLVQEALQAKASVPPKTKVQEKI